MHFINGNVGRFLHSTITALITYKFFELDLRHKLNDTELPFGFHRVECGNQRLEVTYGQILH